MESQDAESSDQDDRVDAVEVGLDQENQEESIEELLLNADTCCIVDSISQLNSVHV